MPICRSESPSATACASAKLGAMEPLAAGEKRPSAVDARLGAAFTNPPAACEPGNCPSRLYGPAGTSAEHAVDVTKASRGFGGLSLRIALDRSSAVVALRWPPTMPPDGLRGRAATRSAFARGLP